MCEVIKLCDNCKLIRLRCIKCLKSGAFCKNSEDKLVHEGDCEYEICLKCDKRAQKKIKQYQQDNQFLSPWETLLKMKKAAIVIDDWKLPIFEQHLTEASFEFKQGLGVTEDTMVLTVEFEEDRFNDLSLLVRAANTKAAASKPFIGKSGTA